MTDLSKVPQNDSFADLRQLAYRQYHQVVCITPARNRIQYFKHETVTLNRYKHVTLVHTEFPMSTEDKSNHLKII